MSKLALCGHAGNDIDVFVRLMLPGPTAFCLDLESMAFDFMKIELPQDEIISKLSFDLFHSICMEPDSEYPIWFNYLLPVQDSFAFDFMKID